LRNLAELFNAEVEHLGRGQVGLATHGNDGAFFDNMKVDAFDPNEG